MYSYCFVVRATNRKNFREIQPVFSCLDFNLPLGQIKEACHKLVPEGNFMIVLGNKRKWEIIEDAITQKNWSVEETMSSPWIEISL